MMAEYVCIGFRRQPIWLLGVIALLVAQAGLSLTLLGSPRDFKTLLNDRPILSGRHPLHLYHGFLGAQAFHDRGSTTCYDPSFQAGYPKTPVFDGGSRPAELFLTLGGGQYRPCAYKLGLFLCLLAIPLSLILAGRGAGLPPGAAILAGACGVVIGWSWPVRRLIEEGEFDYILAGLSVIIFVAWLGRYVCLFGVDSWLILAVTAVVGWYASPVVWLGLAPLIILYYLVHAPRMELAWHLGLSGITAAGLAPNIWWLTDWGRYWWLRQPATGEQLPMPSLEAIIGSPADYVTLVGYIPGSWFLVVIGLCGMILLWRSGNRTAAALLTGTAFLTIAGARVLATWPRSTGESAEISLPLAAGILTLPAVHAMWAGLSRIGLASVGTITAIGLLLVTGWVDGPGRAIAKTLHLRNERLLIGLSYEQEQVLKTLREQTTQEARILWDETTDQRPGWNWTSLLPVLTDRAYIGGLDHDAGMAFSFCGLRDGKLNSRSLEEWTDAQLLEFCHIYNVGWVVCRSSAAAERWSRLSIAKFVANLSESGQQVLLLSLERRKSFILSGSAKWESATTTRISLSEVVPDELGFVNLSLHYPEVNGLRVWPTYVHVESHPNLRLDDPLNFVRLHVRGPVPRITLVWETP